MLTWTPGSFASLAQLSYSKQTWFGHLQWYYIESVSKCWRVFCQSLTRFDKFGKVVCQTARKRSIYPQPSHPRVAYQKHQQEIIPKISPWELACCSVFSEKWKPCDSRVRHRISTAEVAHGLLWTEDVWCLCFSRIVIVAWMSSLRK